MVSAEEARADYEAASQDWVVIPDMALNAVVAAEDPEFFARAAQNSPITGQLAHRYITVAHPTVLLLAIRYSNATMLARALTHSEILNWYGHEVWLGEGCFGLPDAAGAYFGKDISALGLQDFALLALLIRAPARFHPVHAPDIAIAGRNQILEAMAQQGHVTPTEANAAAATDLHIRQPVQPCNRQ